MPLLIKRYLNRKLYNTHTKKYISLDQLAELMRQGVEIQVLDHASGEDMTALTLSQILLEQEKRQSGFVPLPLLTVLVQAGGDALESFRRLFARSFDLDRAIDEDIVRRIKLLVAQGMIVSEEGERLQENMLRVSEHQTESSSVVNRWINRYLEERGYASRADFDRLEADLAALADQVERLSRKD